MCSYMAIVLAGKKSGITNRSLASTKTFDLTETHCNAESQSVIKITLDSFYRDGTCYVII